MNLCARDSKMRLDDHSNRFTGQDSALFARGPGPIDCRLPGRRW
jgi:hypothetical protein